MPASRDRSVVRSSVIPSAKYCCSRSSLRFVKGSTTIDRRGRTCTSLEGGVGAPAAASAAAGDSLNAAAVGAIAVEDAAQSRNLNREVVVLDDRPRPGGGHDLVTTEENARAIGEDGEYIKCARADRDRTIG